MAGVQLSVEQANKLEELSLPSNWRCVKAEVRFEREGVEKDWAMVYYDARNKTFYIQTNKAVVYPDELPALKEAIKIMAKANEIIGDQKNEQNR